MYAILASRVDERFWWDGFTFDSKNVPLLYETEEEANLDIFRAHRGRNISNVVIRVVEYTE